MSQETKLFYYAHNVTSTSYAYGKFHGPIPGNGNLKTSGSSTTVTSSGGGAAYALSPVAVGDLLAMYRSDTLLDKVKVTVKAAVDSTSITVASAVNWDNSGVGYGSWEFWKFNSGTAVTDGWHDVKRYRRKTIHIMIASLGETDGIKYQLEGLVYGPISKAVILLPEVTVASAAAPYSIAIPIGEDVQGVRLGLKRTTATTGTDVIDVQLIGDPVGAGVAR